VKCEHQSVVAHWSGVGSHVGIGDELCIVVSRLRDNLGFHLGQQNTFSLLSACKCSTVALDMIDSHTVCNTMYFY
jgi:hypothetical protein